MAGFPMAWALLASPTCQPNGPSSTRCSVFLGNNRIHTRIESPSIVVPPRKRNFCSRDKGAETVSLKFNRLFAETRRSYTQPRHFGHFASQELIIVWLEVRVLPAPPPKNLVFDFPLFFAR